MKQNILKFIALFVLIIILAKINIFAFRSDYPLLVCLTFLISVAIIIYIPFTKIFKNNKNQN